MKIRKILLGSSLAFSLILSGCAGVAPVKPTQNFNTAEIVGNPQGNITIVEYYDYECPHCHDQQAVMDQILANNPNVRLVYRVYPILTPTSWYAAKAAIAANQQGKFLAFHETLMSINHAPTVADIDAAAQSVGLNMLQFKQDMNSPIVMKQIEANIASVGGLSQPTPLIFVGNHTNHVVFNQETSYPALESAIVSMEASGQ